TGVAVKQTTIVALGKKNPLIFKGEWAPPGPSCSGKVGGEVVFAGSGITAKENGYDDYAGNETQREIVLLFPYEPPPKNDKSPFQTPPRYSNHATLRAKANNASDHGAIGMILVDFNHTGDKQKELLSTSNSLWRTGNRPIAAQVKRDVIEKWLEA